MSSQTPTIAEAVRATRSHPSLADLTAHRERRLGPDETARIESHLVSCPSCARRAADLARFLDPRTAQDPALPDADGAEIWQGLADALGIEAGAGGGEKHRPASRPRTRQTLAATLLLTTALATWGWLTARQRVAGGEVNIPVATVEPGAFRREARPDPEPVQVLPGAVLIVTPPLDPAPGDHEIRIFGTEDRPVWTARRLRPTGDGTFQIRLPHHLRPGTIYRIRISPGEGQEFAVRLTEAGPS